MTKIHLRAEESRWGSMERGDEWFTIDAALRDLDDLPLQEIVAIEAALDPMSAHLIVVEGLRMTFQYKRSMLWIARRLAGISESYADFHPGLLVAVRVDGNKAADADPPVRSPRDSAATSQPRKHSSAPTRRSPANTTSRPKKSAS